MKFLGKLMYWGVNTFSSPEQGVVFVLDAEGKKSGELIKVRTVAEHDDAYFLTAAPVVACLKQYLDGSLNQPGLWLMGNFVDDSRLMKDIETMGIKIKTEMNKEVSQYD